MIEIVYQTPWLDNEGDFVFLLIDISHTSEGRRIAVGFCGFLIGIIFHI